MLWEGMKGEEYNDIMVRKAVRMDVDDSLDKSLKIYYKGVR